MKDLVVGYELLEKGLKDYVIKKIIWFISVLRLRQSRKMTKIQ